MAGGVSAGAPRAHGRCAWVATLAVRGSDADGIILPPKAYYGEWVPFQPEEPPNMGRFYWRH